MKKSLILIPTLLAASTAPLNCIVSCSKNKDIDVTDVYNKAIEYFVGTNYDGGICKIPHPHHNLDAIREWLIEQIKACGIETVNQDDYGNLWYDVPATPDCKSWKPLCLQAHMDMVWAVRSDENEVDHPIPVHDFDKDGREIIHTEGYKTSLGADNGAGLAIILALTANKNLSHGPLRCIITADEETGMNGAGVIGQYDGQPTVNVVDHNQGFDYLLNLDAETEGDIFVSCAGGYNGTYKIQYSAPTNQTNAEASIEKITENDTLYQLDISGGMGGHSGINMINDPINAVITCAQFLSLLPLFGTTNNAQLVMIDSHQTEGNVIPGSATFIFALPKLSSDEEEQTRLTTLNELLSDVMEQVAFAHPKEKNVEVKLERYSKSDLNYKLTLNNSSNLLSLLVNLKFGPQQTRTQPDGTKQLVSSSNVCPVNLSLEQDPHFDFSIFDRSEDEKYLYDNYILYTLRTFVNFVTSCEGDVAPTIQRNSQYPAYVYNQYDKIREKVEQEYQDLNIKTTQQRTHGGIECAWWYRYNENIQQASIGPTILDVHDPNETLYLDTYQNLIKIVVKLMQQMDSI